MRVQMLVLFVLFGMCGAGEAEGEAISRFQSNLPPGIKLAATNNSYGTAYAAWEKDKASATACVDLAYQLLTHADKSYWKPEIAMQLVKSALTGRATAELSSISDRSWDVLGLTYYAQGQMSAAFAAQYIAYSYTGSRVMWDRAKYYATKSGNSNFTGVTDIYALPLQAFASNALPPHVTMTEDSTKLLKYADLVQRLDGVPNDKRATILNGLAWSCLTINLENLWKPTESLSVSKDAVDLSNGKDPNILDTYALALHAHLAELGAERQQALAVGLASEANKGEFEDRRKYYAKNASVIVSDLLKVIPDPDIAKIKLVNVSSATAPGAEVATSSGSPPKTSNDVGVVARPGTELTATQFGIDTATPGHLFPSLIHYYTCLSARRTLQPAGAQYSGYDPYSVMRVCIPSGLASPITGIRIVCPEIMRPTEISVALPSSSTPTYVYPIIAWDWSRLLSLRSSTTYVINAELINADRILMRSTQRLMVHPVHEAVILKNAHAWEQLAHRDDVTRMSGLLGDVFATYVTPNDPVCEQMRAEALQLMNPGLGSRSFKGYQGDAKSVILEVMSLWSALQKRGLSYSNITDTDIGGAQELGYLSQHVRLPRESVANTQANCVDGTVLLASLIEKIGIEVGLVWVRGHMFLAYRTTPYKGAKPTSWDQNDVGEWCFLETTALNSVNPALAPAHLDLMTQITNEFKDADSQTKDFYTASSRSYFAALEAGQATYNRNVQEKTLLGVTLLNDVRNRGITPIPSLVPSRE